MKRALYLMILLPLISFGQENSKKLLNMVELTVKMNHQQEFNDGMQKWKDCYLSNNGTDTWNVWNRMQGQSGVVAVTYTMDKWAEMDEGQTEADKACMNIFKNDVFPHIENMNFNLSWTMPEYSRTSSDSTSVVWVTFFRTNNSTDFMDVVKEVSATYRKEKGQPMGVWYDFVGGGMDSPDYMVATPYKNFAQLDEPFDGPWAVYEKAHSKEKMEQMRSKFRSSVDEAWSYLYKLNPKLSHQKE